MKSIKILTVDGLDSACDSLTKLLKIMGFSADGVSRPSDFPFAFRRLNPDLLLLGSSVSRDQMESMASALEQQKKSVPVLFVGHSEKARRKMGFPGEADCSFLPETFQPGDMKGAIERLVTTVDRTNQPNLTELDNLIIGKTPAMMALKRRILQIGKSDLTVLLCGESGTGKEVVARATHKSSPRAEGPFIRVNSAGFPMDLFESELFGFSKGAFTGAIKNKPGKFQLAHKGMILLDEIGEVPLPLQAKLLHILEDKELSPLGSTSNVKIDTRVLAATNANLEKMVSEKRFRTDLYYRLSVVSIHIPPLRERKADIDLLSEFFLEKYTVRYDKPFKPLPNHLREQFHSYAWPGNVRQLENAIRCLVAMGSAEGVMPNPSNGTKARTLREVCAKAVRRAGKKAIEEVLLHTDWNRKEAAAILKTSYRNLLNKIKEYEIEEPLAGSRFPDSATSPISGGSFAGYLQNAP